MGSTLNEEESEKQVIWEIFSESEKVALVLNLPDLIIDYKMKLGFTWSQNDLDMGLKCP